MYIEPWQIFAGGCVCGMLITFIVLTSIVIRIVTKSGVKVEHHTWEDREEDEE